MKSILLVVLIFAPSLSFYDEVETKPSKLDNSDYIIISEPINHEQQRTHTSYGRAALA